MSRSSSASGSHHRSIRASDGSRSSYKSFQTSSSRFNSSLPPRPTRKSTDRDSFSNTKGPSGREAGTHRDHRNQQERRHQSSYRDNNSSDCDSDVQQQTIFSGTKRRDKVVSIEGHLEMKKPCKGLIAARVMSGDGTEDGASGRRSDPWGNANDEFLGTLIMQVWQEVRMNREQYHIAEELYIQQRPLNEEAREVSDTTRLFVGAMVR